MTLAHRNPEHEDCLFTDASDKHWGLVVTQVPPGDIGKALAIQRYNLLHFLLDSFLELNFIGEYSRKKLFQSWRQWIVYVTFLWQESYSECSLIIAS
jgi:hypothetical protein